jgi:hypothetical protein
VYVGLTFLCCTTWLFNESRQVLLGWFIALLGPTSSRLPRKWVIAIACLALIGLIVAVFALTPLREKPYLDLDYMVLDEGELDVNVLAYFS